MECDSDHDIEMEVDSPSNSTKSVSSVKSFKNKVKKSFKKLTCVHVCDAIKDKTSYTFSRVRIRSTISIEK